MIVRFAAAVIAVAVVATLATPGQAAPAPEAASAAVAPVTGPDVASVNRHLAALIVAPSRQRPLVANHPATTANFAAPRTSPARLLSPALLDIVSRYTKAEHLLHFKGHGWDANFWGAIANGPGVKVHYTIKF